MPTDQAQSLRRLVLQSTTGDEASPHGALILVCGTKADCGTSTFCLHLALAARRRGPAALVEIRRTPVDRFNAASVVEPRATLRDVLRQERTLGEAWRTGPCGLRTLDGELPDAESVSLHPLLHQLQRAASRQAVVVDVPSPEDLIALLPAADHCVFLTPAADEMRATTYQTIKAASDGLRGACCWLAVTLEAEPGAALRLQANVVLTCDRCLNLSLTPLGVLPWDDALAGQGESCSLDDRSLGSPSYQRTLDQMFTRLSAPTHRRLANVVEAAAV